MMSDPAPTLDLDAIEARCAAATSDPWVVDHNAEGEAWLRFPQGGWISAEWRWEHDAEFASHARTDVPALLALVRRLKAENSELRAENRKLQTRLWNKLAGVDVE